MFLVGQTVPETGKTFPNTSFGKKSLQSVRRWRLSSNQTKCDSKHLLHFEHSPACTLGLISISLLSKMLIVKWQLAPLTLILRFDPKKRTATRILDTKTFDKLGLIYKIVTSILVCIQLLYKSEQIRLQWASFALTFNRPTQTTTTHIHDRHFCIPLFFDQKASNRHSHHKLKKKSL